MQALKFGPSYTSSDLGWDAQRTVNLIPEIDDTGEAKSGMNLRLITAPGTSVEYDNVDYAIRGMCQLPSGLIVLVVQDLVHAKSQIRIYDPVNKITTLCGYCFPADYLTGPVQWTDPNFANGWLVANDAYMFREIRFAYNGFDVVITDGGENLFKLNVRSLSNPGYIWTFMRAADGSLPFAPVDVTFIGGYFVFAVKDTLVDYERSDKFYISGLYDTSIDPLDVATAEYKADGLESVAALNGSLWLFGHRTLEVWANTGAEAFPFERIMGAVADTGILNRASLQQLADAFIWLACTSSGRPFIAISVGYTPTRISTTALDTQLNSIDDFSGVTSFAYNYNGHYFYGLNVPGLDSTFVYDLSTKMWHERTGYNHNTGGQTYVTYRHHSPGLATGLYVSRPSLPGIYKLTHDNTTLYTLYEPNGTAMQCSRVFPLVADASGSRIRHNKVQLDASAGSIATQPAYTLQWSDDSGRTFNSGRTLQPADVGEYTERFIWRRLGQSRSRLYKLSFSTTEPISLRSVMADAEVLGA